MARSKKKTAKKKSSKARAGRKVAKKKTAKRASRKPAAPKAPAKVDFDDEDAVLVEFAKVENDYPESMNIDEQSNRTHTGVTMYEISIGRTEWNIYESEEAAHDEALARVKQDLEHEPELFNQNWLMSHVDMDKVKEWVYDDAMESDYIDELRDDDFWEEFKRYGLDTEPYENADGELEDEEGDTLDPPNQAIDDLKEAYAKEVASDPEGRIRDIWGDEASAKMMEIGGIDIDAAAEDAIATDGWAHFISTYDGNYHTTPSGFVYFRVN